MSDEAGTAVDAAVSTPTPVPALVVDEPANPSKRDFADLAKNVRSLVDAFSKAQVPEHKKTAPKSDDKGTDLMQELESLRFEINIRDALADAKILDANQRELVALAAKAAKPADLKEFVGKYAPKAVATPIAIPAPVIPQAPKPPDTGPAASSGQVLPTDPSAFTQSMVDQLTPEQAGEWWERRKQQQNSGRPNLTRRSKDQGGDMKAIAEMFANALSKVRR